MIVRLFPDLVQSVHSFWKSLRESSSAVGFFFFSSWDDSEGCRLGSDDKTTSFAITVVGADVRVRGTVGGARAGRATVTVGVVELGMEGGRLRFKFCILSANGSGRGCIPDHTIPNGEESRSRSSVLATSVTDWTQTERSRDGPEVEQFSGFSQKMFCFLCASTTVWTS
ncbi:hypothetical protein ACFX13_040497 [Malus domestica]